MSQKVDKRRAKSGGRQRGAPNKANVRMRELFQQAGFEYHLELIAALKDLEISEAAAIKLDALVKMAPYFMQRLREESEETPTPPPIDVTPEGSELTDSELEAKARGSHTLTSAADPLAPKKA